MRRHYSAIIAVCDRTRRDAISCRLVVVVPFIVCDYGDDYDYCLLAFAALQSSVLLARNRPKSVPLTPKTLQILIFFEKKWCDCLPIRKKVVPLHSLSETEAH